MKAKIKSKKEVAQDTLLVEFDMLGQEYQFIAGQYLELTLLNPPFTDQKGDHRTFSIVAAPEEKNILKITTRLTGSAFKNSLKALPIGTEVNIDISGGNFILPPDVNRPIVFITGGIGITPMMSMLSHAANQQLAYNITLLYSNRNRQATAFFDELNNLAQKNKNFKLIATMTDEPDWPSEKRRIDGQFIRDYISYINNAYYMISGPEGMVKSLTEILLDLGVKFKNIKTEEFPGY